MSCTRARCKVAKAQGEEMVHITKWRLASPQALIGQGYASNAALPRQHSDLDDALCLQEKEPSSRGGLGQALVKGRRCEVKNCKKLEGEGERDGMRPMMRLPCERESHAVWMMRVPVMAKDHLSPIKFFKRPRLETWTWWQCLRKNRLPVEFSPERNEPVSFNSGRSDRNIPTPSA